MEKIKLFYECIDSDEDEIKDLQKTVNKWIEKNYEEIEIKKIVPMLTNDDMDMIIMVHYKSKHHSPGVHL